MTDEERAKENEKYVEGLRNMLAKHNNDWAIVASELYTQTAKLREDRRDLRSQIATLEGKLPKDTDLVLSGDDKALYERFKALGTPDEIQTKLDAAVTLERSLIVNRLATKHSLKESVLAKLLPADAEIVVVGEGDAAVFQIKQGDKSQTVDDMIKGPWADFAPALQVTQEKRGITVLGQSGGGNPDGATDYVAAYLQAHQPAPKE